MATVDIKHCGRLTAPPHTHTLSNSHHRQERKRYYSNRQTAVECPDEVISVIVDGMDQNKTNLPSLMRVPKSCQSLVPSHTPHWCPGAWIWCVQLFRLPTVVTWSQPYTVHAVGNSPSSGEVSTTSIASLFKLTTTFAKTRTNTSWAFLQFSYNWESFRRYINILWFLSSDFSYCYNVALLPHTAFF